MCVLQLLFCLNFFPHILQANFGSIPHSKLICLIKCVFCLYVEPHFGQGYLPLASGIYLLRTLQGVSASQDNQIAKTITGTL